ncbi:Uncharacterized protein FKW44_000910, partial [Caligus rogercresseyi]
GIGHFIESLNDDSLAIVKANKLFKDPNLLGQLAFIKGNFTQLVRAISSLQERLPLTEGIGILEMVQMQLTVEPFASKLNSVLEKNPDFEKIKFYSRILKREILELEDDPKLPFLFSCAPITSVDCERVFSELKSLLFDQRTSLTERHVKDMLILSGTMII